MELIWIILGILLYFAVIYDIIKTTLSLHGGGWLTSPFSHALWLLFLKLAGGNGKSRFLEHVGYLLLILILLLWIAGLWGSFFLLLISQPDSIISSSNKLPADAWQKLYYAGFTISTLGIGDYVGSQNLWRVITDMYAFSGLVLITMSITYFVPVLSGVILQRNLGITLSSLGQSPQQMVLNSWDGKTFHRLTAQASSISNMLIMHSQNHKAYPIIHYFHTHKAKHAIILRIATLYDTLFILSHFVKKELKPSHNDIASLQTALENYIEVITEVSVLKKGIKIPPKPQLEKLIAAGLVDVEAAEVPLQEDIRQKRLVLATLVEQDGWSWQDVKEAGD